MGCPEALNQFYTTGRGSKYFKTCLDCGKYIKTIDTGNNVCRHINSKKHQKNKLINDNKCYNTLLSLVRSDLPNDLLGLINKNVINNYETGRRINRNCIRSEENTILKQDLYERYNYENICQITYNNNIQLRLSVLDDKPIQYLIDNKLI